MKTAAEVEQLEQRVQRAEAEVRRWLTLVQGARVRMTTLGTRGEWAHGRLGTIIGPSHFQDANGVEVPDQFIYVELDGVEAGGKGWRYPALPEDLELHGP